MIGKCKANVEAMCQHMRVIRGDLLCGYTGPCALREELTTAPATANYPAGSMGEAVESEGGAA